MSVIHKNLSLESIRRFGEKADLNPNLRLARNAVTHSQIDNIAMNWEVFGRINHTFSNMVSGEMKVTNQEKSGRCWIFAGLNLLRIYMGRKYNLKQFEFSQNYFMFWDKLEKSNYFLENCLATLKEEWNSRLMMYLLENPIQDGGQWQMFANIIEKYGVVPKESMPESFQSSNSSNMNGLITRKLREYAKTLRTEYHKGMSVNSLRTMKEGMLETIYQMLVVNLGTPPRRFDWQVNDKKGKFHRFENLTPQGFFREHVGLNLKDMVCLINCPMSDKHYEDVYTIKFLGNVIEGNIIRYLNLKMEVLKKAAQKSIQSDEPVWFGCDFGKYLHRDLGILDTELYDYRLLYGTDFSMDKAERLEYGDSRMTHAMLFTGVDLKKGMPVKWRVENSHGDKTGKDGYLIISDSWFDEYLYEVVVHKKHLSESLLNIYKKRPVELPPWDPMGALAE